MVGVFLTVFKRKRSLFMRQIAKQRLANDEHLLRGTLFSEDNVYRRVEETNGKDDDGSCARRREIAKYAKVIFSSKRRALNTTNLL